MNKYTVSVQCLVFATCEVEAENKESAETTALSLGSRHFDVDGSTLLPQTIEKITEN